MHKNDLYAMGNLYRSDFLLAEQTIERMKETMSELQVAEGKRFASRLVLQNE